MTRPTTRWRATLAVASVAAIGAALFSGTASASTEAASTPVPIVTPDGVVFSYLLNTKVANPGQTNVVSKAVQKGQTTVVNMVTSSSHPDGRSVPQAFHRYPMPICGAHHCVGNG